MKPPRTLGKLGARDCRTKRRISQKENDTILQRKGNNGTTFAGSNRKVQE